MEENLEPQKENITPVNIRDEMRDCFLDYAMSVIISRALPDIRDGLKPVHRRALFAMNSLGNFHNKAFLKSARVVGDVIGKYHPHGDAAVYSTIVRMAQDFSMRYPLVDGQGNFGSIDGDSAAAMRYTEIRMRRLSEEMLRDLDKETIEWRSNYDDSLKEPVVLPTKIPNLLVNGSSGIAVGMATNIPPHNLTEIMQGLTLLVDNETTSLDDLMKVIHGPDFPTGGEIQGIGGIRAAYETGKGVVYIRAMLDVEPFGKDRERIVVKEIPYMVNKSKLIEKMAQLVNMKQLEGISDIRDESNKEGIRICIDLKKREIPNVIINRLYKMTQLQVSFGIIFLSISNGIPKVMNLKEQLSAFIDHRREVVIKRTIFELKKARERAHILMGLKVAVENIDEVVTTIRRAPSPVEAKGELIIVFSLSEKQAQAILEMRLQRLTGLERDKIIQEYKEMIEEIARLEGILDSEDLIKEIIKHEFSEVLEKYGDERRTKIVAASDEIIMEDLIKKEDNIVTITHKGYIKRMPIDTYKAQKRGGKGVRGAKDEGDFFRDIFMVNTHSRLLFFTDKGIVFSKKVYEIPEGSRTNKGRSLVNLINVSSSEKITEVVCISKEAESGSLSLLFATEKGLVKKTSLKEYQRINQSGLRAIKVVDGDCLIRVRVVDDSKDVLLCSSGGKIIRFLEKEIRQMGRNSQGVKGMSIGGKERVIGMEVIDDDMELLSVTENGYGKRSLAKEYRSQSRGGRGVLAMRLTEKNGEITAIRPVRERDDLVVITDRGQVIRTSLSEIALLGRATQGVRIIKLKKDEKVVAVEKMAKEVDEDQPA